MSKEYIEREVISEGIRKYYYKNPPNSSYQEGFDHGLDKAQRVILDAPVADVVEVRRGRWEFGKDLPDSFGSINKNKYHLYCSECRHQAFNKTVDNDPDFDVDTPFCPWCGSKMVEEEVRENIKDAPTAAVVEVRHGQWIRKEDDSCYWYECSECGEKLAKTQWGNDYFSAYCPNCGTLMDKEER